MVLPYGDRNPARKAPYVTVTLLAANIAVFFLFNAQLTGCEMIQFIYRYAAIPQELLAFEPLDPGALPDDEIARCVAPVLEDKSVLLSAFTAMFLHGGLLHLGFNMLFLWVFGNNVEDRLGHARYLLYYLAGGLAATGVFVALNPGGVTPMLGASGAIAAVLGGYLVLYPRAIVHAYVPFPLYIVGWLVPRARTTLFLFIFALQDLPAWVVLGIWFGAQLLGANEEAGAGVAYSAHVGGFVAGIVFTLLLGGRPRRPPTRRSRQMRDRNELP
jgi:membrane associated rhomboid family serine protease